MLGHAHERPSSRQRRRRRASGAPGARGLRLVAQTVPPALRGAALMPGAALAVHQLRYELTYGHHTGQVLAAQGHAYLFSMTPWIVLLATLALGVSLGVLARRWASAPGAAGASGPAAARSRHPFLRLWLLATVTLVAVYAGQEFLEGLFASGHPGGLAGIFGHGGLWAVPIAAGIGGVLALALSGGAAVVAALRPSRRRLPSMRDAVAALVLVPPAPALVRSAPLSRAAAGRAPPRLASPSSSFA